MKTDPRTTKEVIHWLESMHISFHFNNKGQVDCLDFTAGIPGVKSEIACDENLYLLRKLPELKILWLSDSSITDKGLINLLNNPNLEAIYLDRSRNITDEGMKYLGELKSLKDLGLGGTPIGDKGLAFLAAQGRLEQLNINSTLVTDAGLKYLMQFENLKYLALGGPIPVTDKGLKQIGSLKKLEFLDLNLSRFTDKALEHIAQLKKLRSLGLANTKVTDKGLKHIRGLSKLKELDLSETKVTKQGRDELKKTLPHCAITISEEGDGDDVDLDEYDSDYFWNNPPKCVAGFNLKALQEENPITFQLICQCGSKRGQVLGYPLSDYKKEYTGPDFVSPLGFQCAKCNKITEIIDTAIHGYDGERGSSTNFRGKGKRTTFKCPKCKSEKMSVTAHFQYDGGELDLKEDDPSITVEDYFGCFMAGGKCAKCRDYFSIADFELA